MRNILVTGGAGFIGSNLIERLLKLDYNIYNLDNFDPFYDRKLKENNLKYLEGNGRHHFIEGDLLDEELLDSLFEANGFDTIVHLAAKAGVRPSLIDPAGYYRANVIGTLNLLEKMKKYDVSKLLFASSSSVYGNNRKLPFNETDSVDNPISPYASTKKAGELLCYTYHHLYDINIYLFRFFTVYGPRQRPEMAIAKFADKILNGEPIVLFGDGGSARDYTYIDDITDGLLNAMDRVKGYEIFNLGESQVVKLNDLVGYIEKSLDKKAKIEYQNQQPGDVDITFADINKSSDMLDYHPKVKIEEGIERYCRWLLKDKIK